MRVRRRLGWNDRGAQTASPTTAHTLYLWSSAAESAQILVLKGNAKIVTYLYRKYAPSCAGELEWRRSPLDVVRRERGVQLELHPPDGAWVRLFDIDLVELQ